MALALLDRFRSNVTEAQADAPTNVYEALRSEQEQNLWLEERIASLEQALSEPGWDLRDGSAQGEFSRDALRRITALSRLMAIKNPLIKRAVNARLYYVWGQGVQVTADDEDVNAVVQAFMTDPGNQAALFGEQERLEKDRSLHTDGNVFLALFTHPLTGRVQVRDIPFDEIVDIIRDPEDRTNVWFYKRVWRQPTLNMQTGDSRDEERVAYYPDHRHVPLGRGRQRQIGGHEVRWFEPVMHIADGGLDGWKFGLSPVYAALDWAKAFKLFLEDWASLVHELSKYAFHMKTDAKKVPATRRTVEARDATDAARARVGQPTAGRTAVTDPNVDISAVSKTGATVDAESGRPLAMMVGAAMDLPYTILMGDPDIGNLATAKTLDRPTELAMVLRQKMWAAHYRTLCDYVIDQAVKAPRGPLQGTVTRDEYDRLVVELADEADRTVKVDWPEILEHDVKELAQAIKFADDTGQLPDETIARLLLTAFGVEDIDEVLESMRDEDGNFVSPAVAAQASAGQAAVDAFRRGEDPAALLR